MINKRLDTSLFFSRNECMMERAEEELNEWMEDFTANADDWQSGYCCYNFVRLYIEGGFTALK